MAFSTASKPTFSKKFGVVLCGRNQITTEVTSGCVVLLSGDCVARVVGGLAILLVALIHLHRLVMISVVVCDGLCGDSHWLGAVDLEVGSGRTLRRVLPTIHFDVV